MVSISFGAKVGLIVVGVSIFVSGMVFFILSYLWWGSWFDSVLFLLLFVPGGLLPMFSAVIVGTKPRYPSYPPYYSQYQSQYPPQPQNFEPQQKYYTQMYDQAYQYGYQQGYWLGLQKAYEQMYKSYGQPHRQYYQQPYQYPR